MRSARTAALVIALLSAVALPAAGCGGSGDSGSTTGNTTDSTETTSASEAKVTSFDVGDLVCGGAVAAPVDVTWATQDATAVDIAVDDFTAIGRGPSGTTTVTVACDDESHQISITPKSDAGLGETETKDVSD
jgi:hypothetical protein